jgi:hypothetical protein
MRRYGRACDNAAGDVEEARTPRQTKPGALIHGTRVVTADIERREMSGMPAIIALSCPGMAGAAEQKGFEHLPFGSVTGEAAPFSLCMPLVQQQHAMPEQQHVWGESTLAGLAGPAPLTHAWAAKSPGCTPAVRSMTKKEMVFIVRMNRSS